LSDEFHASDENIASSKPDPEFAGRLIRNVFGSHYFDGADCEFANAGKAV